MKTRWLMAVLAAALLGCAPPEDDQWPPQGNPQLVAGTWAVTLRRGAWTRLLPTAGPSTHGRLTLRPSADSVANSTGRRVLCGGCLRGTFRLDASDWLPPARSDSASAAIDQNGTVWVMLNVSGSCSDCGNLFFHGRLRGNRITGGWTQQFLGPGMTGTFLLRRPSR